MIIIISRYIINKQINNRLGKLRRVKNIPSSKTPKSHARTSKLFQTHSLTSFSIRLGFLGHVVIQQQPRHHNYGGLRHAGSEDFPSIQASNSTTQFIHCA